MFSGQDTRGNLLGLFFDMTLNTPRLQQYTLAPLAVLAFCLFMIGVSRGMGETYGVFLLPLTESFEWSRASVTSIFSVYMIFFGFGSLISGLVFDRIGPRFNYIIGLSLLAGCYGFAGHLNSIISFYLVLGVCGGVGAAMVGIVPTQSLILRWFTRKRSTALSVAYSGQGIGVMMLVPAAQMVIEVAGWQDAYMFASYGFIFILCLVLLLPWASISAGAKPTSQSLMPDSSPTKPKFTNNGLSLSEAVRRREFWGFFTIFGATAIAVFGVSLQTVAYLIDHKFDPISAAFAYGLTGMLTILGIAITGILAERFPRHIIATGSYTLTAVGILALACLQLDQNWTLLVVFITCFGLSAGARGPIITAQMGELFAGRGLASIFGATGVGNGCGAAIGAFLAGYSYDLTGSYSAGFGISLLFLCVGLSMFWLIPGIRQNKIV
jgi:MFS family permease